MSTSVLVDSRLHTYARDGKKSKLKTLLKNGNLILMIFCYCVKSFFYFFLFIEKINLDSLDVYGQTALYIACFNGHKGCAKLLLKHGASPNE